MTETQIIAKAVAELNWTKAKLAAIGYPGVAEVEQSVERAIATLAMDPEAAPDPAAPAEGASQQAAAEPAASGGTGA